jgi:hypothetical protein
MAVAAADVEPSPPPVAAAATGEEEKAAGDDEAAGDDAKPASAGVEEDATAAAAAATPGTGGTATPPADLAVAAGASGAAAAATAAPTGTVAATAPPPTGMKTVEDDREQDRYLPIANISRIMKKALPPNAKIAKDAKETVQECVSEFISFITSEGARRGWLAASHGLLARRRSANPPISGLPVPRSHLRLALPCSE